MNAQNSTPKDDAREALDDVICEVLGRFRDIGVGPERTSFRKSLLQAIQTAFDVRPRGPVTDEMVERAVRRYHEPGHIETYRDAMRAALETAWEVRS